MANPTPPVRSLDYAAAKAILDEAINTRDARRAGLVLAHPSLTLRCIAADALAHFGTTADVPELIAALEQNQVVYGGGTEEEVLKEDLNATLVVAIQRLTGLDFGPVDPASDADVSRVLADARKWRPGPEE